MVIFGVDPGSTITGYGVIKVINNSAKWLDSGVIRTPNTPHLHHKLEVIYDGLVCKMGEHHPDVVCIEEAFYAKNVHTTLVLGHARGVAMLAASKAGARIEEYSPRSIKKSLVGNGNAAKEQVAYMVKFMLSPPVEHAHNDAYDALAAALCGFTHISTNALLNKASQRPS
jgi:crossover junction endodeoxyribonuclease RuvC